MLRKLATAGLVVALATVGASVPVTPAEAGGPTPVRVPPPEADYRFQNTLASSVAGAPPLANLTLSGNEPNQFVSIGNRRALRFAEGNGLRLGNAHRVIGRGNYTIALRVELDQVSGYARLVNYKTSDADTGVYVQDQYLVLYDLDNVENDAIPADTFVTIVVARSSATGRVRGYVNGGLAFNVADPDRLGVMSTANVLRFFRDNSNREESAGTVARIRLWDRPLTPTQVAVLSGQFV